MRIYEFAKLLNISNKELIDLLTKEGFEVKSHMSALSQEAVNFLNKRIEARSSAEKQLQVTKKPIIEPTQMHVSKQKVPIAPKQSSHVQIAEPEKPIVKSPEVKEISQEFIVESMSVGDAAQKMNKPVNELIMHLLKQGIVCAKNQMLPASTVEQLAKHYQLTIAPSVKDAKHEVKRAVLISSGIRRLPIIVVVGHVDHGKTTLLDFIRNTRLASKEKGGITQHLGAYEVTTTHGNLIFLDTPGHEAFSNIRGRGLKVADIAILVIAADDGIMPQTVEAIKRAQSAEISVIVAINKIDKVDASRLEVVKRELARYNLMPEEWGGTTVCVPISAKTGKGVDHLLEMLVLQAELMDLKADPSRPGIGFVLESRLEKGRGPVATVICQEGTLKIGEYFAAGHSTGKISSLMNSSGKMIKEAGPSIPVQVAGFSELPIAGESFEVISQEKYLKLKSVKITSSNALPRQIFSGEVLNFIVKTDASSSKEALLESLSKIAQKATSKKFNIIYSGIGNITESDVTLATDTGSEIVGLHVKIEANAAAVAQRNMITIHLYDIIYKLLEDVEKQVKEQEKVRLVSKKIGEAMVRKIFDIKNIGIIAGCYLKEGRFPRECRIVVWRGKKKIGEGSVKELERDRKPVKEVHAGFEFAFLANGFDQWEVDDRIECFLDVPEK